MPRRPSLNDYTEACREYRERTGKFLAYRDFQSGIYEKEIRQAGEAENGI